MQKNDIVKIEAGVFRIVTVNALKQCRNAASYLPCLLIRHPML